jgi:rhodanese-related sulfurtransferase
LRTEQLLLIQAAHAILNTKSMSHQRLIIVGGVAGGASAAARARRLCEDCEIIMFERGPHVSFANCGLLTLAVLGCVGLASLGLWWLADHRRGIAWAVSVVRRRFPNVSHLSPSALDAWLRDAHRPAPQTVDARSEEEVAVSHLASSRRIDPESTAATALSILDPERPIVLYCSAGHRAATLARRLHNAGRVTCGTSKAASLPGRMLACRSNGPVKTRNACILIPGSSLGC